MGINLPAVGERELVDVPAADDLFANLKAVVVLSAIGDQLELRHQGFPAFIHSEAAVPISDWSLDKQLVDHAREVLSPRFAVLDAPDLNASAADTRLIGSDNKLRTTFPELPERTDADAYVVLVKHPIDLVPGINSRTGTGPGVWDNSVDQTTQVYAHFAVVLIDAHTRKLIRARVATTSPLHTKPYGQDIDRSLWAADAKAFSPDKADKIQKILTDILADTLKESLLSMGLTGKRVSDLAPALPQASVPSPNGSSPAPVH